MNTPQAVSSSRDTGSVVLTPYGDAAILVTCDGNSTSDTVWAAMHALADSLVTPQMTGIEGVIASYDSVLVEFDPYILAYNELAQLIHHNFGADRSRRRTRTHLVPAVYGGAHGPDLAEVADELAITEDDFIEQHSTALWRVAFCGAPAGAPMLDGSPFASPVARCAHPRVTVPAGSIAVSGLQGVIYPIDSPGGWRLVARTPLNLIDITRSPHLLYEPGDYVQFMPIAEEDTPRFHGVLLGEQA